MTTKRADVRGATRRPASRPFVFARGLAKDRVEDVSSRRPERVAQTEQASHVVDLHRPAIRLIWIVPSVTV